LENKNKRKKEEIKQNEMKEDKRQKTIM